MMCGIVDCWIAAMKIAMILGPEFTNIEVSMSWRSRVPVWYLFSAAPGEEITCRHTPQRFSSL